MESSAEIFTRMVCFLVSPRNKNDRDVDPKTKELHHFSLA